MDERTACKFFISDIMESPINQLEESLPFIEHGGHKVSTVRVMGSVVSRYDKERFSILTLDDSTETISVRAFGEDIGQLQGFEVGDIVDVIGVLRAYEEETYIVPRIISRVDDPNWEVARKLELLIKTKKTGVGVSGGVVSDVKEVVEEDLKGRILRFIEKLDDGAGADYKALLKESSLEEAPLDSILNELLSEGEIYEPKLGRLKKV